MKLKIVLLFTILILFFTFFVLGEQPADSLDYSMSDAAIEWLYLVRSGASNAELEKAFMENVAPTPGCQCIIRHWARFRKDWNNQALFKFIMQGLERIPTKDEKIDKNGHLTLFGRRCLLWQQAVKNPEELKARVKVMQKNQLLARALKKAADNLPANTSLKNDFYLVLFGHSSAFSVGDENGIDLLQLPLHKDRTIDFAGTLDILAHELHHTGFSFWLNRNLKLRPVLLTGILASEGSATYLINRTISRLDELKSQKGTIYAASARDWEKHLNNLPALLDQAARDIADQLAGRAEQKKFHVRWLGGTTGPAYVVGSYLFETIDRELGRQAVKDVIRDFRILLHTYNRAARKMIHRGESCFVFPEKLALSVKEYGRTDRNK